MREFIRNNLFFVACAAVALGLGVATLVVDRSRAKNPPGRGPAPRLGPASPSPAKSPSSWARKEARQSSISYVRTSGNETDGSVRSEPARTVDPAETTEAPDEEASDSDADTGKDKGLDLLELHATRRSPLDEPEKEKGVLGGFFGRLFGSGNTSKSAPTPGTPWAARTAGLGAGADPSSGSEPGSSPEASPSRILLAVPKSRSMPPGPSKGLARAGPPAPFSKAPAPRPAQARPDSAAMVPEPAGPEGPAGLKTGITPGPPGASTLSVGSGGMRGSSSRFSSSSSTSTQGGAGPCIVEKVVRHPPNPGACVRYQCKDGRTCEAPKGGLLCDLAVGDEIACAQAPSEKTQGQISASPNPCRMRVVNTNQMAKCSTTLSWSATPEGEGWPQAQVTMSINGSDPQTLACSLHGERSITLEQGRRYVFRLYAASACTEGTLGKFHGSVEAWAEIEEPTCGDGECEPLEMRCGNRYACRGDCKGDWIPCNGSGDGRERRLE